MEKKMTDSKRAPINDLRDWLKQVADIGELCEVKEPVERDEEMSAIGYLVAKQKPSPAILYNNIKGFENSPIGARSLWNVLGPSVRRIALTLGEDPNTPTVELIRRTKDKLKQRTPPREVEASKAPIYENSLFGDDVERFADFGQQQLDFIASPVKFK
jgi:4-hydroxy-3-polyprenylbenzoate decarboxylase